jgi:hypothetical protein
MEPNIDKMAAQLTTIILKSTDAQLKAGIYINYYDHGRPHSLLGYKSTSKYATMEPEPLMLPPASQM